MLTYYHVLWVSACSLRLPALFSPLLSFARLQSVSPGALSMPDSQRCTKLTGPQTAAKKASIN